MAKAYLILFGIKVQYMWLQPLLPKNAKVSFDEVSSLLNVFIHLFSGLLTSKLLSASYYVEVCLILILILYCFAAMYARMWWWFGCSPEQPLGGLLSHIIVIYYYIPGASLTVNFFLLFMAYLKDSKTSQLTLYLFAVLFIIVYF